MRKDCTKKARCEEFSYNYCRLSCEKRKDRSCILIMTKKQKKEIKQKEMEEKRRIEEELIKRISNAEEEGNISLPEIKHRMIDCNNPPLHEELLPEQIYALEMWKEDVGKNKLDYGIKERNPEVDI